MLRRVLQVCLSVSLLLALTAADSEAQTRRFSNPAEVATPRARTGETIILGKDDVIRVADMSPHQYRQTLTRLARQFRQVTDETVYFASGSSTLDAPARERLNRQAAWIMANPRARITVTGYTDATGDPAVNREVGLRRARAVAAYLVRVGVPRDRLVSIASEGERRRANILPPDSPQLRRAITRIVELADPGRRNEEGGTRTAQAGSGSSGGSGSTGGGTGGSTGGTGGTDSGGSGGGATDGGSTGDTGGNNGKAHGRNGTQPGRNR